MDSASLALRSRGADLLRRGDLCIVRPSTASKALLIPQTCEYVVRSCNAGMPRKARPGLPSIRFRAGPVAMRKSSPNRRERMLYNVARVKFIGIAFRRKNYRGFEGAVRLAVP